VGAASAGRAQSTLVAEVDEAEDLRRRIKRPISGPEYEVNLEEVEVPEPMEEITLDSEPLPVFEPEAEPGGPEPTLAPVSFEPPAPPAPFAPVPVLQAPAAVPGARISRASEPAPLTIEVEAGRTDVSVPIELQVEPGVEEVAVNLRLLFKIRR
jgi:hypothetical protein